MQPLAQALKTGFAQRSLMPRNDAQRVRQSWLARLPVLLALACRSL
jgi:hypothetical protein